jgi:hypothetical protein
MKKVKIFLSTITILAAVGGALAFKAKTYSESYCIRKSSQAGACTAGLITSFQAPGPVSPTYFYTITSNTSACFSGMNCGKSALRKIEGD